MQITGELNVSMFKDTMYYLDLDSRTPTNMAHGVIVGVIGAIMALQTQPDFEAACALVKPYLPKNINTGAIPNSWVHALL